MQNIESKIRKNAKIAVLCGGMSSEREVSIRSGKNCFGALKRLGYENAELVIVDENIADVLKRGDYDVAYNALHGRYGEDGCIQGLLEIMKIPYTGCGVKSSAICMDKCATKEMLGGQGIPIIKSVCVTKIEELSKCDELKFPMMVKPAQEGSSIGMTKVDDKNALKEAFLEANAIDDKVLIEEYLQGESATVGVLEGE